MCWERRDLDAVRSKLQEDFRATRERGKFPRLIRMGAWVAIAASSILADLPVLSLPAIVVFEAFVAPRLARRPARKLGPLREWKAPEGLDSPSSALQNHPYRRSITASGEKGWPAVDPFVPVDCLGPVARPQLPAGVLWFLTRAKTWLQEPELPGIHRPRIATEVVPGTSYGHTVPKPSPT
jgi:hypothetical protein